MTNGKLYLDQELMLQLEQATLTAKRRIRGAMQGKRRSRQLGSSLEFADYREYAPGDDTRRFDWSVYGRTGKPFIKQYMDEQELQVHLFVDASVSMNFGEDNGLLAAEGLIGNKFNYAKRLAACIGYIALASYDRVDAACFTDRIISHTPLLRGKGSASRLFQYLETAPSATADVSADPISSHFSRAFMNPHALSRQQGVTWIFSDFLAETGIEEALSYLMAAKQEIVVVQVLNRLELEPELIGDLRLIDSETLGGKEVALSNRVLRAYRAAVREYTEGLRHYCFERGIAYMLTRTDMPLADTVLKLFRQAGVVQ